MYRAWGDNGHEGMFGVLGDGTTEDRHSPVRIMNDVIAVSAGSSHSMAITSDGTLWGWGNNWNGQLGDGTTTSNFSPTRIMDDVVAVSAGSAHTMAVTSDGELWAWGSNNWGQLGCVDNRFML